MRWSRALSSHGKSSSVSESSLWAFRNGWGAEKRLKCAAFRMFRDCSSRLAPGGGGGTSVIEGDRDVPLDRV